jgi:2-oxoglutarate ferredoxin oxidoreductase subunit beta
MTDKPEKKLNPQEIMHEYLRHDKAFPHLWCAGCGIGIVMGSLIRAIYKKKIDRDRIVMVSGIGCSSRMPIYLDFNTLHTTHGRALAFATGIKFARPELEVIVVTGDGDVAAIGGNHLIHACRRNVNLTVVCVNNNIYGMTGGQASPTTPFGDRATTAPYGSEATAFDLCKLTEAAGASFVARGVTRSPQALERLIVQALEKKGFAFIDVLSQCPTYFGRFNKFADTVEMLEWQKEHTVPVKVARQRDVARKVAEAGKADKAALEPDDKFPVGVLVDIDRPEYTEVYEGLIERALKGAGK